MRNCPAGVELLSGIDMVCRSAGLKPRPPSEKHAGRVFRLRVQLRRTAVTSVEAVRPGARRSLVGVADARRELIEVLLQPFDNGIGVRARCAARDTTAA